MCKVGLSMTAWNFLLSLTLLGFTAAMICRGRKK
jgi:disulfide bond formation protein DsbB